MIDVVKLSVLLVWSRLQCNSGLHQFTSISEKSPEGFLTLLDGSKLRRQHSLNVEAYLNDIWELMRAGFQVSMTSLTASQIYNKDPRSFKCEYR
jgi:hypothetical protein